MIQLKRNIDIILIVLVGFVLRFTISYTHSYSNDELSAVSRLRFDNFSDLLEFGVKQGDMHPAGVQVFMKCWASIFGTSELFMRLPFVLFGTASICLLFLLGKKWFNREVGLIAASLLTVLYFPIMHAEYARPYSPGLLLILLVVWFVDKLLFDKERRNRDVLLLGIFFAMAMYTHYFAFLTVAIIGFSGVFFLTKENWKGYVLSGVLGMILFVPHIGITLFHLSVESTDWISAPPSNWLILFVFFVFNSSWGVVSVVIILLVWALIVKTELSFDKKKILLLFFWFFGIYAIGHFISLWTPVLKFPVALFIVPFLFLLLGIILSKITKTIVVVLLIGGVGISSTIIEKELYGSKHFAVFKEASEDIIGWENEYGKENIYSIFNINNVSYLNYYANQKGDTIELNQDYVSFGGDAAIRKDLIERTEEYCIVGYAGRRTLLQTFETVKEFYPELVDFKVYKNEVLYLFKKGDEKNRERGDLLTEFKGEEEKGWLFEKKRVGSQGYLLDEQNPYGPDYVFQTKDIDGIDKLYLKIEVDADIDTLGALTVAISGARNGGPIQNKGESFWLGRDLEEMLNTSKEKMGYFAFKIPGYILPTDELKISLWNRSGRQLFVNSVRIYLIENKWG